MTTDQEVADYINGIRRRGEEIGRILLEEWETPATAYPIAKVGKAAIARRPYTRGIYAGNGIRGVHFFDVPRGHRLPITTLMIGRKVWMVDDPPHWWSIQDTAERLHGRVLVGGLGLGLILHALVGKPAVDHVVVVEREADVISLMAPNLPKDLDIEIVAGDFYEYVETRPTFDTAFVDLWVTHGYEEGRRIYSDEVLPLAVRVLTCTGAPMYALGFTGSEPILG